MSESTTPAPDASIHPDDLVKEAASAAKLSGETEGVKCLLEGLRVVNDAIFAQVVFALWDSGFYEYSLTHRRFSTEAAADALHLDARVLGCLLDYLIGRGILDVDAGQFGLTDYGVRMSNLMFRGTMNLYIGGWGPLIHKIGPLLRGEITLDQFNSLRSPKHTVGGTEQLGTIRALPAVAQLLARRQLHGVLHLACRTGEFLIGLARSEHSQHGVGIDRDAARIAAAQSKTREAGLHERLSFITGEIGRDAFPVSPAMDRIQVIAAMYLLHEVARHGRQSVIDLLRQVKAAFPGRMFLFMETLPYAPLPAGSKRPATFTPLDYLMIHRLRKQGLPLPPDDWRCILDEAGLKVVEVLEVYGNGMYLAEL